MRSNPWLAAAATANFAVAVLHVAIVVIGPAGYLYFGTAGLAQMAANGSPLPAILTLLLALIFVVFGVFALSYAGWGRPLPASGAAVFGIAAIFSLRGLILIPDLLRLVAGAGYAFRQTVFSAAALAIGVVHFIGWAQGRRSRAQVRRA